MEKHYDLQTQLITKPALYMFRVDLPTDFTDRINKYVDDELIPLDKNYGKIMYPFISRYDSFTMEDFIVNMKNLFESL